MTRKATCRENHPSMSTGTCPRSGPESHVGCDGTTSSAMSAPEFPAPTTSTPPSRSCEGFRYSDEWSCTISGASSRENAGIPGSRLAPDATMTLSASIRSSPADTTYRPPSREIRSTRTPVRSGRSNLAAYASQVRGHLVLRRARTPAVRIAPAGEPDGPRRREQTQGVVASEPGAADLILLVKDHEGPPRLSQVVAGGQARLPTTDHHGVEPLRTVTVHRRLLGSRLGRNVGPAAAPVHRRYAPTSVGTRMVRTDHPERRSAGSGETVLERERRRRRT